MQNIEENAATIAEPKPRKSKAAIASFVLALLSVPLFPITALPAIIFGIVALVKISRHNGQLTGKRLAITGICIPVILLACFAALFSLWKMDAPPIEKDWSVADLRSAAPEYSDSYDLLLSLRDVDYLNATTSTETDPITMERVEEISALFSDHIDKSLQQTSMCIQDYAVEIESAWESAKQIRQIIKQLSTYKEIADNSEMVFGSEAAFTFSYRRVIFLYKLHTALLCEQGNSVKSANQLIEIDSVSRKLSLTSRTFLSNLTALSGLFSDILIANFIINHPDSSEESIEILAEHFKPLTEEHMSIRNAIISEYLTFKHGIESNSMENWNSEMEFSTSQMKEEGSLKVNSTLRLFRNTLEKAYPENNISQPISIWPSPLNGFESPCIDFKKDFDELMPIHYQVYNLSGTFLVSSFFPPVNRVVKVKTNTQIYDDLFQIALAMRLGEEYDLTARAYGGEYIVDVEKKIIFSVGPDEEAYTDDDISLPINPAVLGLVDTETKIGKEQI